ncbi:Pleckstrin-likey domain-containing family G member 1 [Papilio machaon]|uniref:Pleckstrin-likey domain-containing family G member 1 n=1 Tax=Papilio machaon TaxID=76193 RepID=A0A194RJ91_PAPMA|nr:Pleckstrin-likey domain-containing family G member 1 [Papilio machaon]
MNKLVHDKDPTRSPLTWYLEGNSNTRNMFHTCNKHNGSTTDLTPTLIGIYDSLLEPDKSLRPEANPLETAKDARNDPPVPDQTHIMTDKTKDEVNNTNISRSPPKDPSKIIGGVKLPIATLNKSSLYNIRTNSDNNGASESNKRDLTTSDNVLVKDHKLLRTYKETKQLSETTTFDNLSPNVKRMISSASETTTLKFQKKSVSTLRSSTRHRCNIPLVGATSKISQSVEIYDQPSGLKNIPKAASEDNYESPSKIVAVKPDFRIETDQTYDIPTNNRPAIYDVPNSNKTAFESLSLPYIDQSIELSITSNDREFDIKLSSKECSPQKLEPRSSPEASPAKSPKLLNVGTNSLHRRNLIPGKENVQNQLMKTGPYPESVGSTGNLKSCAVPEKEIPRLNPPTVEVTRPLSMSSIASSSSTSSSGVQNKGGVNSAYLASIESLDDHSDVDMTSANGSNNFVNNAGILNASVSEGCSENLPHQQTLDEMSGLSQLERVCAEIVQTEKVYVEDLRQVVEGYLHVWRRNATFSDDELSELFNNIEDIYAFNRSLCEELNTCRLDATCIARCFVNNTSGFAVYTSYCTGYPRTMERLAALASKPQSAREFRERQMELQHPLPLASYLLKPVQRILKYHLLLQNVVKQCASRETEYALLKMTGIAQHIDDMKRRHEHAVRVQVQVFGAKAMRHAFLFDKMLLVTKNREDGILAYKSHIMCNNMMLVESIAGAPLSFHVIPWDAPRSQLTLQARSPRHKREWTLLLKRVILENYNAVIPSHARQLVMELGQNKTDDDMIAEKSHNLITQASMRKQLSAPEYLEKRKVDRERRKSFENGIRGRLKKGNRKYTLPSSRNETLECDCAQVSAEKGTDYTCDNCYIDICSDCETEISNKDKVRERHCDCVNDTNKTGDKCPECDRTLHYIDSGSAEHLERKQIGCKCPDFKSSQESFSKEYPGSSLNKTRGYHSSDNIIGYTDSRTSKDDLSDTNNSLSSVRNIQKTCLKCTKIKENIPVTDSLQTLHTRRSRCVDIDRPKIDNLRSKSKDDPQRSKLSKIGTWRRKSEPGLQQNNIGFIIKKSQDSDIDKNDSRGNEKIEFECRSCGSNKISRKTKNSDGSVVSDLEGDTKKKGIATGIKSNLEIKMYNTKNIPKKISKIKKNRAKGFRVTSDTSRFYTDFSTDVSTENILHISESNDSLNVDKQSDSKDKLKVPDSISKDEDIDEETYKRLIEKTDSFKKNELEKVKYLHNQKVINESSELEDKTCEVEDQEEIAGSCEETEQPLEQIISQLLLENREFQKLLKKQQQRNSAQRRHQRLLKSHSNPDQVILSRNFDSPRLIPKYTRQTSENLEIHTNEDVGSIESKAVDKISDDDHIYETLRVESRSDERLHSLNSKSKTIQHNTHVPRPKKLPSPPSMNPAEIRNISESDYVYLSFNKQSQIDDDGIYDVPVKSPQKVKSANESEYYVTMEKKGPPLNEDILYDNLIDVCRRNKEVPSNLPCEYLPMGPEQQSPNTPEIWLSRQKEHFNVSRDRKSGSLPRSFQVPTNGQDENNLSSFKCKPNGSSKTYLNRDGKVMSTDRPFTIASDQSELSYDDVENYMSENDIFKFCKVSKSNDPDYSQNISQSTLELEEEIDRCYKNNFEKLDIDANKNETSANLQTNLNTSTTSSCEVLPIERDGDKKDNEVIHPEHKIYKPTANVMSLKNVLSRFKSKNPNKSNEESEINANDQSNSENTNKSPTNEKRSALNPRSYSRNLLQRFRSIIGDEPDDIQAKYDLKAKLSEELQNRTKSDIKVVITTDTNSTTTIDSSTIDVLSKSMHEGTTMNESQKEKNQLEALSHSCDDLVQKTDKLRPNYSKSISMVTSTSSSVSSSPLKSNNSSHQNLNKLPIYMQGSKYLGARIAQSDYVDPTTLGNDRNTLKTVNVLINKNAVRPDSLFSNSSFVTSSSESTYQEPQTKQNETKTIDSKQNSESSTQINSDESFYEKSFEKIEHFTDEDVFRDSAVYSDQEDYEPKECNDDKIVNKTIKRIESLKREASVQSKKIIITTSTSEKTCTNSKVTITTNKIKETIQDTKMHEVTKPVKAKIAPPVPVKPKIGNISQSTALKNKDIDKTEQSTSDSVNKLTVKRNVNTKTYITRSESSSTENARRVTEEKPSTEQETKDGVLNSKDDIKIISNKINQQGNIQLKRLSFERASLDSATRKIKLQTENRPSETPKIAAKTVLERRMELEMMTKSQVKLNPGLKKPYNAKPKSITTKVASFERSVSENHRELKITPSSSSESDNIPVDRSSTEQTEVTEDLKGSWVKQVVNKFQ